MQDRLLDPARPRSARQRESSFGGTLLVLLGALLASVPLEAAVTFGGATNLSTGAGSRPQGIAIADLDGDGNADLAITDYGSISTTSTVSIFLGDGAGGFSAASGSPMALTGQLGAYSLAVDDFDGDGEKDLAVVNLGSDTVSVLLGNGDGAFSSAVSFPIAGGAVAPAAPTKEPISLASGDFDHDTRRDLAVADFGSGAGTQDVQVFLNTSSGIGNVAFATGASVTTGEEAAFVVVGDLDGDTWDDIAVSNHAGASVSVLLNDQAGGFPDAGAGNTFATNDGVTAASNPSGLAVADMNEDGDLDLLAACAGSSDQDLTARVAVFLGDGSGALAAPVLYARGDNGPLTLATADIDGDEHADIVVANSQNNTVSIYTGDGAGALGAPSNFTVGTGNFPFLVAAGRVDADGKPDVVATDVDDNVAILLNTTAFEADLSVVSVSDGVATAVPGTADNYTVTIRNDGPAFVPSGTLALTLPGEITFTTFTPSKGAFDSATGAWTSLDLASGQTATLTAGGTIGSGAAGTMTFTAAIAPSGEVTDPASGNDAATDNDTALAPQADLGISKSENPAKTRVAPGEALAYEIVVSNAGPSDATNATLTDAIPSGLTGASWTCAGASGGSCASAGSGSLDEAVTVPVGGSATFTVNATVSAGATGAIANTASVAAPAGATDPAPGNNSATDTDAVDQAPSASAQSVTVDEGTSANGIALAGSDPEGDPITFAIVASPSHGSLSGLDASTGQVSYTPTAGYDGPDSFTFRTTDSFGVASATAAAVTITVRPTADLSVAMDDGLGRVAPGQGPVSYSVAVANAGPAAANMARVSDAFPAALTGVTWDCVGSGGGTCAASSGVGDIDTTVDLPSGGTATFTVAATVSGSASGSISNTATIAPPAAVHDPVAANNSATDTDAVDQAPTADAQTVSVNQNGSVDFTLQGSDPESDPVTFSIADSPAHGMVLGLDPNSGEATYQPSVPYTGADSFTFRTTDAFGLASMPATVTITVVPVARLSVTKSDAVLRTAPGASVSYTINVANSGPSAVTGARVTDALPEALTGAGWTCAAVGGGSCPGAGSGDIDATVDLPAGATAVFSLDATVSSEATGSVVNAASVTPPTGTVDDDLGDNSATDTDSVDQAPTATPQDNLVSTGRPLALALSGADPEGDPLVFDIFSNPAHGVLSGFDVSSGAVVYTPNAGFGGADSFSFRVTDAFGRTSGPAMISLIVVPATSAVHFGAASYAVTEGGTARITVRREDVSGPLAAEYTIDDGTAKGGIDYVADSASPSTTTGLLSFKKGSRSQTFQVKTLANTLADGDRTVVLDLREAGGAPYVGGLSTAVLTIRDNDAGGTIQFSAASYTVDEGDVTALVRVTRKRGAAGAVTVDFTASGGTATPGPTGDYEEILAQPVSFGARQKSVVVPVTIHDNGAANDHETVDLLLSDPAGGATLGSQSAATLTIVSSNPVVQFAAANFSASESKATITVKRSGRRADVVTADYTSAAGTAQPGTDYVETSGVLTFRKNATSAKIVVPVVNDKAFETSRTVLLSLSNPQTVPPTTPGEAVLGQQSTTVLTIDDKDKAPTVQFSAKAFKVKESGSGADKIRVKRKGATGTTVTVQYAADDVTAVGGTNYTLAPGTLTFLPGDVSLPLPISILDTHLPEGDLELKVRLSDPVATDNPKAVAELGNPSEVVVTIQSDNPLLQFSAATYKVGEAGPRARITVKRSGATTETVLVDYATADGTATSSGPHPDYVATTGTLTFAPRVKAQTFDVDVTSNGLVQQDKTVDLILSNPQGEVAVGPRGTAVLTLLTDDPSVQFARDGFKVAERAKKATITLKRTGNRSVAFSVPFSTSDGSALDGINYSGVDTTVDFPKGAATRSVSVPILNDDTDEPPPLTVGLALGSPSGALLGTPDTAALVIADDDVAGQVQFDVSDYSISETGITAVVTVTRARGKAGDVTVDWTASDATATAGANYTAATGTLTFAQDQKSAAFTVDVQDDGAHTGSLTVDLALSNPQGGATLGARSTATLWIADTE
jgi:uncharacterized repeat protein (TIGR01451 family)